MELQHPKWHSLPLLVHLEVHSLMVVAVKLMEVVSHWSPLRKYVRNKKKRKSWASSYLRFPSCCHGSGRGEANLWELIIYRLPVVIKSWSLKIENKSWGFWKLDRFIGVASLFLYYFSQASTLRTEIRKAEKFLWFFASRIFVLHGVTKKITLSCLPGSIRRCNFLGHCVNIPLSVKIL